MFSTTIPSPLGDLTLVSQALIAPDDTAAEQPSLGDPRDSTPRGSAPQGATPQGIAGIYFDGHSKPANPAYFGEWIAPQQNELFVRVASQLDEYFQGNRTVFDLPLAPRGDEFHRSVWQILSTIPFGTTVTYGAIAEQLGNRHLAQAVGGAVGRNPISIIIPCHRVVGANGALTGFAGGLPRKSFLLELEEPATTAASRLF